jgi:hypothetical protein
MAGDDISDATRVMKQKRIIKSKILRSLARPSFLDWVGELLPVGLFPFGHLSKIEQGKEPFLVRSPDGVILLPVFR